jgi:hypothetical protein
VGEGDPRPTLPYAEVMASYACNLSCLGCTNYSNYNYKGYPAWEPVREHLRAWLEVLRFGRFGIIGGEPLLNPHLETWLRGVRDLMPGTPLLLVTNGTRLRFVPKLLEWLAECAPSALCVAPHVEYDQATRHVEGLVAAAGCRFEKVPVAYEDVDGTARTQWHYLSAEPDVRIELIQPRFFIKSFQGFGAAMRPWDHHDPAGAIAMCPCRYCPLLYEGRLYKCSQIGLLRDHLARLGLIDAPDWQPYVRYRGIAPDDGPGRIARFVDRFGEPEGICAMCPSERVPDAWIDHTITVMPKEEWQRRHGTDWPPRPA